MLIYIFYYFKESEYDTDMDNNYNPLDDIINASIEDIDDSNRLLLDIIEEDSKEDIDDLYRSLLDIANDTPVNNDVLEEESSNFKGFDGEYGPYFPNFTSMMIFIWITKHMICK